MSEKKFDVGALVNNGLGHPLARALAEGLWKTQLVRRFASQNPEMTSVISKGVMALTSLLEVGGDHPIARFGNYLAETLATENLELFKQFQENPDDPKVAERVREHAVSKAGEGVYVALHHIHKSETCLVLVDYKGDATPPAFGGKPGQPPRVNPSAARIRGPLPLADALAVTTALCGKCYPATSFGKPEESHKPKEVVPGRNFIEYVMRFKADDAVKCEIFWRAYLERLEGPDGAVLAGKFQEAFNGKHSYEAFRFVVGLPPRTPGTEWEEWHHALDALLGKVTPHETLRKQIGGFISEEKRQTEEMFLKLFAWIERSNAERAESIAARKARIAKLDEDWTAARKAKKTGKTVKRIVAASLLAILAIWYVAQRAESADTRPATAEQKEIPNER